MTEPTIRRAEPEDAGTILAMIRKLAVFENAEHHVKATEKDLLRDGWCDDPKFEALIAELEGEPVGFALFFTNYSTWEGCPGLYVEDLYVDPAARGRGVGRLLIAEVARIVVARGYRRLDLAVLHWNPARAFYASLGVEHLEEWLPYRATGASLQRLAGNNAEP